jgi:membrane fusion protein (multidrug efflux system)
VRENEAVHKGDVLFRIDAEPLQIAVARMQAQVESVQSLLDAARSGYSGAQADVRSAAADLDYKKQQFQRLKELRARGLERAQGDPGRGRPRSTRSAPRQASSLPC